MGASKIINTTDTHANWVSLNPVLSDGELGYAKDTYILKVGDGVTPWNDLEGVKILSNEVPLGSIIGVHKEICYPTSLLFKAGYHKNGIFDGTHGKGLLTGTPFYNPTVLNDLLDLTNGLANAQCVKYAGEGNADSAIQKGCVRFRFKAGWTGFPETFLQFFEISSGNGDNKNLIRIVLDEGGLFFLNMWDKNGAQICDEVLGSAWLNANEGQSYEVEVNWDFVAEETRVFLDGVQIGAVIEHTGLRDNNIHEIIVGGKSPYNTDFHIDEFKIFNQVVHTANYGPFGYDDTLLALPADFENKYLICEQGIVQNEASPFYGLPIPTIGTPFSPDVLMVWKILE